MVDRRWFRQVLSLLRVEFRQVFGLLMVQFRQVFGLLRAQTGFTVFLNKSNKTRHS